MEIYIKSPFRMTRHQMREREREREREKKINWRTIVRNTCMKLNCYINFYLRFYKMSVWTDRQCRSKSDCTTR